MDITNLVRAKRRCSGFARVGIITASFLILPAFCFPILFILVSLLIIASYSAAKCNRIGVFLQTFLFSTSMVLIIYAILEYRNSIEKNFTPNTYMYEYLMKSHMEITIMFGCFFLLGLILNLLGFRAASTYQKLLPENSYNNNSPSILDWLLHKLAFLYSGRIWNFLYYFLLAIVLIFYQVGVLLVFLEFELSRYLPNSMILMIILIFGYLILVLMSVRKGYYFFLKAKRIGALGLQQIKSHDQRSPVLLLRSFQDDLTPIDQKLSFGNLQPSDFYSPVYTFEEAIEKVLWDYGPVIAIGRPGEVIPPAGAAREYVSNDQWQSCVKKYILEAKLIVVILGKTSGLLWEYQQLARSGVWNKLVILFPPTDNKEIWTYWTLFHEAIGIESNFEASAMLKVLMATFAENGTPRFFTCKWRNDEEIYQLALRCGLAVSLAD